MSDILSFLQQRQSSRKLVAPAPNKTELEAILQAASRAPDHALLKPYRFLVIEGEGLQRLGAVLAASYAQTNPQAEQDKLAEVANKALRAPMIIAVIACLQTHVKVPEIEQHISAGCAAYGLLLAANALGYGGIWRTGVLTEHSHLKQSFGLDDHEAITGFLYLGTDSEPKKTLAPSDVQHLWQQWP